MRNKYPLIACLGWLCVLGCGKEKTPPAGPANETATNKVAAAKVVKGAPPKTGKVTAAKEVVESTEESTKGKSEFEFKEPLPPSYTDPFFPETVRLHKKPEVAGPVEDRKTVLLEQIVLKGISGPVGRRLALINNYTFAAGESGAVRLLKGTARIEVLEVKERSAVIKVENDPAPKEIFLRPEP